MTISSILASDLTSSLLELKQKQQPSNGFNSALSSAASNLSDTVNLSSSASQSDVDSSESTPYDHYSQAEKQIVANMIAAGSSNSVAKGYGNAFSVLTTLTSADKQLVKQSSGWDIDADPLGKTASPSAFALAGRLNLDRYSGTLSGPVTASYLQSIASQHTGAGLVPLDTLYKAEASLNNSSH